MAVTVQKSERIAVLRAQIAAGAYVVDTQALALAILARSLARLGKSRS